MKKALVIVALALAIPAPAGAATLLSVGQVDGHLTAAWTPGGEIQVIQAATSPAMGTDGYFFDENRKLFDIVPDFVSSYTSSDRLAPGTYYVAVRQWNDACVCAQSSNILSVTIPNTAPKITGGSWQAYRQLKQGSASIEICDDEHNGEAPYRVLIAQERVFKGKVLARASTSDTDTTFGGGCSSLNIEWNVPAKLIRVGQIYRLTFTVIDPFGLRAVKKVSGRWK